MTEITSQMMDVTPLAILSRIGTAQKPNPQFAMAFAGMDSKLSLKIAMMATILTIKDAILDVKQVPCQDGFVKEEVRVQKWCAKLFVGMGFKLGTRNVMRELQMGV